MKPLSKVDRVLLHRCRTAFVILFTRNTSENILQHNTANKLMASVKTAQPNHATVMFRIDVSSFKDGALLGLYQLLFCLRRL